MTDLCSLQFDRHLRECLIQLLSASRNLLRGMIVLCLVPISVLMMHLMLNRKKGCTLTNVSMKFSGCLKIYDNVNKDSLDYNLQCSHWPMSLPKGNMSKRLWHGEPDSSFLRCIIQKKAEACYISFNV